MKDYKILFSSSTGYYVKIKGYKLVSSSKQEIDAILNHRNFDKFFEAIVEKYYNDMPIYIYEDGHLCCVKYRHINGIEDTHYELKNNRLGVR